MIVVAGSLSVDPDRRDSYLVGTREVIRAARATEGCVAFVLAPDPLEVDRIVVYEQWTDGAALEAFRGSGPSSEQMDLIRSADVHEHVVTGSRRLA